MTLFEAAPTGVAGEAASAGARFDYHGLVSLRPGAGPSRDLSFREVDVIWAVLRCAGLADLPGLWRQLESAKVATQCPCGCPAVVFAPPSEPVDAAEETCVRAFAPDVEVAVVLRGGQLHALRTYGLSSPAPPSCLPDPTTLDPVSVGPAEQQAAPPSPRRRRLRGRRRLD